MARVLNIKNIDCEKSHIILESNYKDILWLEGNSLNMHIFSENNLKYETKLVQRGKRESTKYFLMPKEFRKEVTLTNNVRCSMIKSNKKKDLYIFNR